MKKISALVISLLVGFSTVSAFAAGDITGSWKFPQFVSGPLSIDSILTFTKTSVSATSICKMNGQSVSVSVSVPAAITDTEITTLGSAQDAVNKDGINCHASIDPSSMTYVVSPDGANLTLSAPGQGSLTLPRQ